MLKKNILNKYYCMDDAFVNDDTTLKVISTLGELENILS